MNRFRTHEKNHNKTAMRNRIAQHALSHDLHFANENNFTPL